MKNEKSYKRLTLLIIPSLVVIGILTFINIFLYGSESESIKLKEERDINVLIQSLNFEVERVISATTSTKALYIASQEVSEEEFNLFAQDVLTRFSSLNKTITLEWVDADNYVRHIYPLTEENKKAIGFNNNLYPNRLAPLKLAKETNTTIATEPINLVQGYPGILIYVPIYKDFKYIGSAVSIVKLTDVVNDNNFAQDDIYNPRLVTDNTIFPLDGNILYDLYGRQITGPQGLLGNSIGVHTDTNYGAYLESPLIVANRNWKIITPLNYQEDSTERTLIYATITFIVFIISEFVIINNYQKQQELSTFLENETILRGKLESEVNQRRDAEKALIDRNAELEKKELELNKRNVELEELNKVMMGREMKMIELKKAVANRDEEKDPEKPEPTEVPEAQGALDVATPLDPSLPSDASDISKDVIG